MRWILLTIATTLLCSLLVIGCARRMAPFSPHRPNNVTHIQAQDAVTCKECHDGDQLKGHEPSNMTTCLRCHRLLPGG